MSSEQPWPNTPPDLAESQPQYTDPYLGQSYSYGGAPQDPAQPPGYGAGNGQGYTGYGDAYGYGTGSGYPNGQAPGGYPDAQVQGGAPAQPGYGEYSGYDEYGQYQQYQQYEQYAQPYAQPYAESYAPPLEEQYAQPYEDQYTQSPYAEAYAESPQPAQPSPPSAQEYADWNTPGRDTAPEYAAEGPGSSQDRLRARPGEPAERREDPKPKPKPKRRRRLVAVVGVLVVVAGGAGAYKFLGGSSDKTAGAAANSAAGSGATAGGVPASGSGSGKASGSPSPSLTPAASVTIPASAGGLTQMTNKVGKAGVSAMQKSASASADLKNAQFAEYEKNGTSTFFGNLTLAQLSKAPDIQKTYTLSGAAGTLSALGATSLKDGQTETPSVAGSAMACGQFTTGGNTLSLCIWVDPSEFGLFAGPKSLTDSQAAQYAEAIETASEH